MNTPTHLPQSEKVRSNILSRSKVQSNVFTNFYYFKKKKKMNCGGNDGNGGKDKNGRTPEQQHREYIKQMDYLRGREEV